jgi:hypothetical protein
MSILFILSNDSRTITERGFCLMYEKRRTRRLVEENEITVEIISKDKLPLSKKITYNISKDISFTGARIQTNAFLPLDTLLKIKLMLTNPPRMVTAIGKVKWVRSLYGDESFEAGLEFVDTSLDTIKMLSDHVAKTAYH